MRIDLSKRIGSNLLIEFVREIKEYSSKIGFKISARGWGYALEGENIISKDEIDKVENLINKCRKNGLLPIDFVAEEEARKFSGVDIPNQNTPIQDMKEWLEAAAQSEIYYEPDWWDGEEYYIQMIVEKIDLKTLFEGVCKEYHVCISTSKGWSSIMQRAEYSRRFKEAEAKGLKCVLLYCGDHDPDGLRISDFLRSNLDDLKDTIWEDGTRGYDPKNLEINRFGLNYDFIIEHNLTWIDNLITGNKKKRMDLSDPSHPNHKLDYVQDYLREIGVRKCEANAILKMHGEAKELVTTAIENYIGHEALQRFKDKRQAVNDEVTEFRENTGLDVALEKAIKLIDDEDEGD